MKPRRDRVTMLLLSASASVAIALPAWAAPDPPVITGTIATYTGNQSGGVTAAAPAITTLRFLDLTTNVSGRGLPFNFQFPAVWLAHAASAGGNGDDGYIFYGGERGGNGGAGSNLNINFAADPWIVGGVPGRIFTTGTGLPGIPAAGILSQSTGGNGGSGGDAYGVVYNVGGNGGHGGNGGAITLNIAAGEGCDIVTGGASAYGLGAVSQGGAGGAGGDAYVGGGADGGDGGHGGNGGSVVVDANMIVRTAGSLAYGILAQSFGGTSGAGGDGGGLYGGGGAGSGSGKGGTVNITSRRAIETSGLNSNGMLAQSVGGYAAGGGGAGGLFAYGGSGASSGDGNTVSITNVGNVTTSAAGADALVAQSIGGGGGNAGNSGGFVVLGGSGAAGGHGGQVTISNSAGITTHGDSATGITAQSIGGGGGIGAGTGGYFSIGGDGDSSGNGGAVIVENQGAVSTSGGLADAIFAQSIAGGGGRARLIGGYYTFGGSGGGAGAGGTAQVINAGNLSTTGFNANGIFAQSAGGGGGRGGGTYGIAACSAAFGGSGGNAGHGGSVEVTSLRDRTITTAGGVAHGIHAQSIGGGGGSGGSSISAAASLGFTGTLSLGGSAGGGGNGGPVRIFSSSNISTGGQQSHALYAQSIGGGGGLGGDAVSLAATVPYKDVAVTLSAAVGGKGGNGGGGGNVTINATGNLATSEFHSVGIIAQSVGGGGGWGGYSANGNIVYDSMVLSASVGGKGGGGGSGGTVTVDSASAITTSGHSGYGISAQSIGGGGGSGGNALALTMDMAEYAEAIQTTQQQMMTLDVSLDTTLGGSGGRGGSGGATNLVNRGVVSTQGIHAHGLLAQSIGGGGGDCGQEFAPEFTGSSPPLLNQIADSVNFSTTISLGSSNAGSGGNGGAVSVENQTFILTRGNFANGVLAQSIGGGGGTVVASVEDAYGLVIAAISPMQLKRNRAASGDGAAVAVNNYGHITTQGGFAHGILAQSIGGGGGYGGINEDVGTSTLDNNPSAFGVTISDVLGLGLGYAGTAGGTGSSGAVAVTHYGSIMVSGHSAHGILAQSAAGSGTAGPVTVTFGGQIIAPGADAVGIYAQSLGPQGQGNITLTLGYGSIVGGSGSGAGLRLDGGASNVIESVADIAAASGVAILATGGNDTVRNQGSITGNVNLGGGNNAFNNQAGGKFNAGALVYLGPDARLTNAGILSPGGRGSITQTALLGDLTQLPTGTLEIDLRGPGAGKFDRITVSGVSPVAILAGRLEVTCLDGFLPEPGQSIDILMATSIQGQFTRFHGLRLEDASAPAGMARYLEPSYGEGVVRLTSRLAMMGDADGNGAVDAADYFLADSSFLSQGAGLTFRQGDFNCDGCVDAEDYFLIDSAFIAQGNWSSMARATVPEPGTLRMLALAALSLIPRRRRR